MQSKVEKHTDTLYHVNTRRFVRDGFDRSADHVEDSGQQNIDHNRSENAVVELSGVVARKSKIQAEGTDTHRCNLETA